MTDEKYLAGRIDNIRNFLADSDRNLSQWAINHWTSVLAQLERKWKRYELLHTDISLPQVIYEHKQYMKNTIAPRISNE